MFWSFGQRERLRGKRRGLTSVKTPKAEACVRFKQRTEADHGLKSGRR